jgi:hypothetical protein
MHSLPDKYLLGQLGCLYGSGNLPEGNRESRDGAVLNASDGHHRSDGLMKALCATPPHIREANAPMIDIVLDAPKDDIVTEPSDGRRFTM